MPGYDRSRIVSSYDENLDEFVCGICQEILKNPVCTKCCGQTYCEECINSWLTDHDTCPNDRKGLRASDLTSAPRLINNLINKLKIKCDNFEKGCTQIVTIEELENHVKNCKAVLCQLCEFPFGENNHDCIENLKIKISEMSIEISSLKEKSAEKSVVRQPEINIQRSTIKKLTEEALRCNVNNYRILKENNIDSTLKFYLVGKCQGALMGSTGMSINSFAENLAAAVSVDQRCDWNAVVFLAECGHSLITPKRIIQIQFDDKLIIELIVPGLPPNRNELHIYKAARNNARAIHN